VEADFVRGKGENIEDWEEKPWRKSSPHTQFCACGKMRSLDGELLDTFFPKKRIWEWDYGTVGFALRTT
jgi:hypothetical protein